MIYDVGSRVTILSGDELQHISHLWPYVNGDMMQYGGKIATIKDWHINEEHKRPLYEIDLDDGDYYWSDSMFVKPIARLG